MAQSTLHFSIGMALGTAFALPQLARAWKTGKKLASGFGCLFIYSYGLGLYATIPSILRHIETTESLTKEWWMNIFLFYPLIEKIDGPSIVLGELLIALLFGLHYIMLLLAIKHCSNR